MFENYFDCCAERSFAREVSGEQNRGVAEHFGAFGKFYRKGATQRTWKGANQKKEAMRQKEQCGAMKEISVF
jgi:hypothetical protein